MDKIQRHNMTTKKGHTLSFFYNPENDLLVVDLIHKSECGGTELLRRTLNENKILKHASDIDKAQKRLETLYNVIESQKRKLEEHSDENLRVLLAYHQWEDGADWDIVCEIKDGEHFNREEAIKALRTCFNLN